MEINLLVISFFLKNSPPHTCFIFPNVSLFQTIDVMQKHLVINEIENNIILKCKDAYKYFIYICNAFFKSKLMSSM
jgi:hypothetical protein